MKDKLNFTFTMPKLPSAEEAKAMLEKGMAGMKASLGKQVSEASSKKMAIKIPKGLDLDIRTKEAARYFSGNIFEKALTAFDKSALVIIGVSWTVALIACGVAFITVKEAAALKVKTETARALEPILPKINRVILGKEQYEPLLARLKKQFPNLSIEISGRPSLQIKSDDAEAFMTWLNAIGYTDAMVPSIRWTMTAFCVGPECPSEAMMYAEFTAEAINIAPPEGNIP